MIILLFRHGHKAFSIDHNPPLSPKGFEQALHLSQIIRDKKIPQATHCWVSEKIRTLQTFENAIDEFKIITSKKSELNERESHENVDQLRSRIQKFLLQLSQRLKESEVHYICTHYDWIEEALTFITCDTDLTGFEYAHWSPGQYLIFDLVDQNNFKLLSRGTL